MYSLNRIKYPDPQGYHAIDANGEIRWVSTPFTVSCLDAIGKIKANELLIIERVGITPDNETVFIIGNRAYPNYHFMVAMPDFW